MRHTSPFLLLTLGLLAACDRPVGDGPAADGADVPVPRTGETAVPAGHWLGVNEAVALGDDFQVSFVAVTEDSRCPTRVQCVWAGRARVVLGPSHPAMRFRPDTVEVGRADSLAVGPFVVRADTLRPHPETSAGVTGPYRLHLAVRRTR